MTRKADRQWSNGRGFCFLGLVAPKREANVGGAMRAAACYQADGIVVQGKRMRALHHVTDTLKTYRHIPVIEAECVLDVLPYDCIPVAVEFMDTGKSLVNYQHPQRAMYVFGPEDGSVPNDVLGLCRDVVYVPTRFCMNLAATVNVLLYDRMAKRA